MHNADDNSQMLEGFGLQLCLHRYRPRSATSAGTALILHGYLDNGGTWNKVAAAMAQRGVDTYVLDQRGYGKSDAVAASGYYHFDNYLADLDAVLDKLAIEDLLLVGHSMGGTVAGLYAGARPERVSKLVLLEGIGPPHMPPEITLHRTRSWLDQLKRRRFGRPPADRQDALERLSRAHSRIPRAILAEQLPALLKEMPDGSIAWAYDPLHRSTSPRGFDVNVFTSFLEAVTCPVLYVGGGSEGWQPDDLEDRLQALGGPFKHQDLPEAGHMMHWTQPEAVARLIADFAKTPLQPRSGG